MRQSLAMTLFRFATGIAFASALLAQTVVSPATVPQTPQDPKILEDGGLSIEPFYWLTQAQPALFGGSTATAYGNLSYLGKSKKAEGVEIGIPAGRANTLRFSYFRVQGDTNTTLNQAETIFGEAFTSGDYMASTYRIQNAKLSWDYLSYTWSNRIRFKTLYEVQFTTISTDVSAPFVPSTTDSSGNLVTASAHGSENLIYPTLGGEFEQEFKGRFRWEAKASAFGIPHHAVIWDAQANVALRVRALEISVGEKAYHFKTSENTAQYFTDTLQGAYVGIRYYFSQPAN